MPSRRAVALILAFWLATTAYVAYRDVWPRYFASGPPAVAIDLADEAAQNVPIRWDVKWKDEPVGRLTTRMSYVEADDTFWFKHEYKELRVEVGGAQLFVPKFVTGVRVTRGGELREQTAHGHLELKAGEKTLGEVTAKLAGTVADGLLTATFEGSYSLAGGAPETVRRTLDPVPVPRGQPLNPLQPVNRINGVTSGREWVVHESNPLNDALLAVAGELGVRPPKNEEPLVGRVQTDERDLEWNRQTVACRVIEYRRAGELKVRTWVRAADGKVLKQEAFEKGETLAIERDE
jgi:hypothetical protein